MLSRPWAADPELKQVIEEFIEKPHSVARLIANSHVVKDLYSDFRKKSQEKVPIAKSIRDLAFAPQRYSSESKVLARLVLTWDAILGVLTALPDMRGRTSAEGAACLATLQWLNPEKALLLSMLADAALELHRVVRAFDTNVCDESELPYELDRYRAVIRKLFVEGNCLHVGLTKIMLQHLSEQRLLVSQGFRANLGGAAAVTEDLKRQCLKRMSAYVVVAESVLEGEFPHSNSFLLCGCFPFQMKHACKSNCKAVSETIVLRSLRGPLVWKQNLSSTNLSISCRLPSNLLALKA